MANIAKNMKGLRTAKGITQEELAERLHVTRQAISSWENGKNQPDIQTLEELAKVFDVTVEEVIYGADSIRNKKKLLVRMITLIIICVVSFLIVISVANIINDWVRTHYIPWPNFILAYILYPLCYILAGSTFLSVIAYFSNVHVKKKNMRKRLTPIGIVLAVFPPLVFTLYLLAIGTVFLNIITSLMMFTSYTQYFFYMIAGVLIYLGVAKEPKTAEEVHA